MTAFRRLLLGVLIAAIALQPLAASAQTPREHPLRSGWTKVRIAKWALLGVSLGFGAYALHYSTRADRAYNELHASCNAYPERCRIDAAGHYSYAPSEMLYQRTVHSDHRAQIGIFGGQVTLLGSVALFIYDLRNEHGPGNIPYPSGAPAHGYLVGVHLPF